jgi:preprotein translocase subunit SecE
VAKKSVARKRKTNALQRFVRETSGELRKVSWPTRREALSLTKVVVIVMIVMAIMLGGLDYVFFQLFDFIFNL